VDDENYSRIFHIGEFEYMADASYEDGEYVLKEVYRNVMLHAPSIDPILFYPEFNQMVEDIDENADKCLEYATRPSIVYIKNKPIYINYDYDLISDFGNHTYFPSSDVCYNEKKKIEQKLLTLTAY
jgi:hypothetical protein